MNRQSSYCCQQPLCMASGVLAILNTITSHPVSTRAQMTSSAANWYPSSYRLVTINYRNSTLGDTDNKKQSTMFKCYIVRWRWRTFTFSVKYLSLYTILNAHSMMKIYVYIWEKCYVSVKTLELSCMIILIYNQFSDN